MKSVRQYDYRYWKWLKERGWVIVPEKQKSGTAHVDLRTKRIVVAPRAFYRPSTRIIRYVMPHEIWHAVHGELLQYACDDLRMDRDLTWRSAVEVVAEAGCLADDNSKLMKTWVTASVVWHSRVGYRYKMSDVNSPEAKAVIEDLKRRMDTQ